ncbi:MAG: phosphotransferase family protein [Gammaproteobacteria bacterium]
MTGSLVPDGINAEAVTRWLADCVPSLSAPLSFELIAGGHSNLTYAVTDAAGRRYVLRRPPLGHVLESAHDMAREHRVVSALGASGVPVAPTYGLCQDPAVNGAPFFVMGFVEGIVLHDAAAAALLAPGERQSLAAHVADVLAMLHAIEPDAVGLGELGRREGYIARQLKRWTRQWEATETHPIPAMDATRRLLEERLPAQVGAGIVHGDYRLGNFIVDGGRIRAVLDWELCTLGDPLADVAYLMNTWVSAENAIPGVDDTLPTTIGGFGSRAELAERYAAASGRDLSAIDYYRAFSYWRIAAIRQGVYKRYLEGAMGEREGVDLELFKNGVQRCAEAALVLLGG